MTLLTITSSEAMGPLDVSVYSSAADPVEFALSSGRTSNTISVSTGLVTVVARRPDGSKLRKSVEIGAEDAWVELQQQVGPSPNEFMHSETLMGLVGSATESEPDAMESWARPLLGAVNRGLANAAVSMTQTRSSNLALQLPPTIRLNVGSVNVGRRDRVELVSRQLSLVAWWHDGGAWIRCNWPHEGWLEPFIGPTEHSENFLKLYLRPWAPTAVGLLNEAGFGPIVIVPPFRTQIDLSFIAKALAIGASDRRWSGNGARAPAALVVLNSPAANDLLAALSGAATPSADDVWNQVKFGLSQDDIELFSRKLVQAKFTAPAEAMLGAHVLLRFMPSQLPLKWAQNLCRAARSCADGPVIAAWRILLAATDETAELDVQKEVTDLLIEALQRPVTLFARTRTLLFDALELVAADSELTHIQRVREYRRFGANAGGLECFWGGSPDAPGEAAGELRTSPFLRRIEQSGELFAEIRL